MILFLIVLTILFLLTMWRLFEGTKFYRKLKGGKWYYLCLSKEYNLYTWVSEKKVHPDFLEVATIVKVENYPNK